MTVRDWIERQLPPAPETLVRQIIAALGRDAEADESQTAELCLAAAGRALDALLSESRFARESALDLLAIDALMAYAYEYASYGPDSKKKLEGLAVRGTQMLRQLMTQRV